MLFRSAQVASILVRDQEQSAVTHACLRGVNGAKFRRRVVPGDQLRLEIALRRRRAGIAYYQASAHVGEQLATECELVIGITSGGAAIDPTAQVHPSAVIGAGTMMPLLALLGGRRLLFLDHTAHVPVVEIGLLRSLRLFAALPGPAVQKTLPDVTRRVYL